MTPKLSILIPTLVERADMFERLTNALYAQVDALPDPKDQGHVTQVEILILVDNREISIGMKRNKLLQMAKGDYTVFVDDDDRVWADYVPLILEKADGVPDCISITCLLTTENAKPQLARWKKYPELDTTVGTFGCCHICPIRRSIAITVPFIDAGYGEDIQWTERIAPLLKTVTVIPQPCYQYNLQAAVSMTKTSRHNASFPDDVLVDLQGLPDWAFFNLVNNESVGISRRKKYAEYLVNIGSPYAKDQLVLDLLADAPDRGLMP